MSAFATAAPAISGPAEDRYAFLKRTAVRTVMGLVFAGAVGAVSTIAVAPIVFRTGPYAFGGVVLVTFAIAHWLCRRMVYGGAKIPGFILACACEGIALGCLLLSTIARFGGKSGVNLVVEALGLTAATALGMLVYAWFSKGELKLVGAFLSMTFVPMLVLMVLGIFLPIGGTVGLLIAGGFVLISSAGLLYRLNHAVHSLETGMHVEAAYEITMGVLVLLWNIIILLNRLRR